MKRDSKCKGPETGTCFACKNSKEISVADVDGVRGRVTGVEDRVVARSKVTPRDEKPLETLKQRTEVCFCSCSKTEEQRIWEVTISLVLLIC